MIVATVAALVLAFGPGAVLAVAATPAHSRLRRIAVAASPSVTYGLLGGAVGWSTVFGRTWPPLAILAFEIGAVAVAVGTRVLASRAGRAPGSAVLGLDLFDRLRAHRADVLALGSAVLATATVAYLVLGRMGSPPGWDSMNHAFMTRRVIDVGSALSSDVCVTGDVLPSRACDFYPLAPHVLWAQVVELTGQRVSVVMLATTLVVMPVTAVIGVFAIVRACGGRSMAAGAAAFLPAIVGPMWPSLITGRLTIALGAALAPSAALFVWLALRTPRARALSAVAAVGLGGLMLAHTYDIIAGALVGLGLLVTRPPRQRVRTWLLRVGGMALGTAAVVAPQAAGVIAARGERLARPPTGHGAFWASLDSVVFGPGRYLATVIGRAAPGGECCVPPVTTTGAVVSWIVALGIVAGVLAAATKLLSWARPFAVAHVLTLMLVMVIQTGSGPARDAVASLFYNDPRRPFWSSLVAPGVLALAGWTAALWLLANGVERLLHRQLGNQRQWVLPLLVVAALTAAVAAVPDSWLAHERLAARAQPDNAAYQRVGMWLRAQGGGVVADDLHRDFVTWIAVDADLPVLRGLVPLDGVQDPDWEDRTRVWNALVRTKPGAGECLLDRFDVRWVVVGMTHMPGGDRTYRPDRLGDSPYLRLAHVDGPLKVYAVDHLCDTGR